MFVEAQGMRVHCFHRHMLLQLMISLKPESQMKNCEICILVDVKTFPVSNGRESRL